MSNNERGFTLVEAIVAMMVCTVGLVAMAELMAVTLRLQQLGRNQTSAVRLAQDKVDQLTTMNFTTNAQAACGGSITADVANHNDIPKEDNGTPNNLADDTITKGYKRRWLIARGPDNDPNLRQVTVRVTPDINDRRTAAPYDLVTFIRGGSNAAPPPLCP
ncbi:MAG TPA: prepilin-type N-terminal cleavage/methylation domain-containing protein [Vicinamibacterales bacterium]|nr:prepilin-type N-terminal cleavage/methylation domain-containing protein [Vicinamibacterales bacterium]